MKSSGLKIIGTFAAIFGILHLVFTNTGINLMEVTIKCINDPNYINQLTIFGGSNFFTTYQIIISFILILGMLFFTESIGFIYHNHVFFWNIQGGYTKQWTNLGENIKNIIIDEMVQSLESDRQKFDFSGEILKFQEYKGDIFLNYFLIHSTKELREWVSKKYTSYFINMAAIFGIWGSNIISSIVIFYLKLGFNFYLLFVGSIVSIVFSVILYKNAKSVQYDANKMVEFWIQTKFGNLPKTVMKKYSD